jgi:hypothetical protein
MPYKVPFIIACFSLSCIGISCNSISKHEKFDQAKWKQYNDEDRAWGSEEKVEMAEDVVKSHKLLGLTHEKMLQLLGYPANYGDKTKAYYELKTEYDVIDPVSGKNLVISFNKDSIITNAIIEEWHKH